MGEANGNPLSKQFKGKQPDFALAPMARLQISPTAAYVERHKETIDASKARGEAMVELPPLFDEDSEVVVAVAVQFVVPSRVLGRHPAVAIPVGEIRIPLTEVKKAAKEAFEKQGDEYLASQVKLEAGP